jgi:uncharacterized protein YdeI (YjbR/CyaY-like superfamily)
MSIPIRDAVYRAPSLRGRGHCRKLPFHGGNTGSNPVGDAIDAVPYGLKWGQACYDLDGRNVVLIHGFKDYCALLFIKGALLKDPKGILIQQTKNVQAARQIRFASLADINRQKAVVKAYISEAIAVEKSGAKVKMKTVAQFDVPQELQQRLDADPKLAEAFHALTPGRQKGYLLYFAGATQSATRTARVKRHAPRILKGLGLDD